MYLIDGYNLLYQTDYESREDLIFVVSDFLRQNKKRGIIVFDGYSPEDLSSEVLEVRFGGNADEELIRVINENIDPNFLTLVSSDKDIIFQAGQKNIKSIKSEQFAFLLTSSVEQIIEDDDGKPKNGPETLSDYNNFKK